MIPSITGVAGSWNPNCQGDGASAKHMVEITLCKARVVTIKNQMKFSYIVFFFYLMKCLYLNPTLFPPLHGEEPPLHGEEPPLHGEEPPLHGEEPPAACFASRWRRTSIAWSVA